MLNFGSILYFRPASTMPLKKKKKVEFSDQTCKRGCLSYVQKSILLYLNDIDGAVLCLDSSELYLLVSNICS